MTALWNWQTCLPAGKRRHVAALQIGTSTRELVACAHGKFHDIRVGDVDLSEQLAGREIDIRAV